MDIFINVILPVLAFMSFLVLGAVSILGMSTGILAWPVSLTITGAKVSSWRRDKETGLPKLPEGWSWEVVLEDRDSSYSSLKVNLKNERGYTVATNYFFTGILTKVQLRSTATHILRMYKKMTEKPDRFSKFAGTYPPKNLKNV